MTVAIEVETADLGQSAHLLVDTVGEPLWSTVSEAMTEAASCTGMAGDDPAGMQWASAYEDAASNAARAAQAVIGGVFQLAALLSATADNYARADSASTVGVRHAIEATVAQLPPPADVTIECTFAHVGGGLPNAPFGWSLLNHLVKAVWPNGHQDRLRRAALAWRRSADALAGRADDIDLALIGPLLDDLPEWQDIRTACWALTSHVHAVAGTHRSLAVACERYAQRLDVAHSSVEHEIQDFVQQSIAIQAAGALLTPITLGISDAVAQGVEGGRIALTVARVSAIMTVLADDVRGLIAALPAVAEAGARVSSAVDELLSIRIISADVVGVPGLRMLSIARDGRTVAGATNATGEAGAVARLADDATLPTELRSALESPRVGEWNDPATLSEHFRVHGSDFGNLPISEYESRAGEFFEKAVRDRLEIKIDSEENTIRVFDPATNTFGSYTTDGAARTYFKPSSRTYWSRQDGVPVQW